MLKDKSTNQVLLVSAALFFALGLIAAIGPTLPELARNNGISLGVAGAIFTALFVGAIPSQVATGWLNDRFGPKPVLVVGLLMLAVGLLGATLSRSLPLTLACMVFAGLGDGVLVVGSNVIVAQSFPQRRASALNLLNVFYGVGAMVGPAIAGASIDTWGTALPALWSLVVVLVLLSPAIPGLRIRSEAKFPKESAPVSVPLYRSSALWLFSFLLLLYVGVEIGTGGWIATYMQRTTPTSAGTAAWVASGFYMALTVGRVAGAGLGAKLSSERLLLFSLIGAVVGGLTMLVGVGNASLTIAAVLVLGGSFGPIFPTAVAIITARFPVGAGRAASVMIAAGSVGGMLIPLLQGALLEGVGAQGLAQVVVVDTFLMLLLLGIFRLTDRQQKEMPVAQSISASPGAE
jgi:fucose permease